MSVELVNGHVLFPHPANFTESPSLVRAWENEVEDAEFGPESRFGHRSQPLRSLRWRITAQDLQEDAMLIDRIMAALKSGLACAPFWGRSIELNSEASGTNFVIVPTLWSWSTTSYVFLQDAAGNYEVRQVESIFGNGVTVTPALTGIYPLGSLIWPVMFGKFSCEGLAALKSEIGEASVAITELTSPYSTTIGIADAPIDGIGGWIIGDTFIVQ